MGEEILEACEFALFCKTDAAMYAFYRVDPNELPIDVIESVATRLACYVKQNKNAININFDCLTKLAKKYPDLFFESFCVYSVIFSGKVDWDTIKDEIETIYHKLLRQEGTLRRAEKNVKKLRHTTRLAPDA